MTEATDLVIRDGSTSIGPVLPLATPEAMTEAMRQYAALKAAVLTENDEQEITVKGKKRKFVKRSGWRRLAIAFGVSSTILDRTITVGPEGRTLSAEFTVRATAPNGRFADGWGACSAWEERFQSDAGRQKMEHDIPATAETRAENRAYSNLFGYGEVSAEEMEDAPGVAKPTCPSCGKVVRESTFNEGEWYCWAKQGGCGWKGNNPVLADAGEIPTSKASPESQKALQAAQEMPRNSTEFPDAPDGDVIQPPQTEPPTPSQPANGSRRGRPAGSKNKAKTESAGEAVISTRQAAPGGRSVALTTPASRPTGFGEDASDELATLRNQLYGVASRLRKLQYIEKSSDLPASEAWEAEVRKTLATYVERKHGTGVVVADLEADSLQAAVAELQGYVDTMVAPSDAQLSSDEQEPQAASVHKPIVRNAVSAPRRSPANEPTQIDPQAALSRARALADLRNRTTALLATREGLIQLTAKDEDRLRLQADTVMERVAQNAFQAAIKDLDTEQLELLVERAKAANQ